MYLYNVSLLEKVVEVFEPLSCINLSLDDILRRLGKGTGNSSTRKSNGSSIVEGRLLDIGILGSAMSADSHKGKAELENYLQIIIE